MSDDRRWILLCSVLACLLVALVAGPVASVRAEEGDANPAPREFGGHRFIPSLMVPDPFISTTFLNYTGAGTAVNHVVPLYNIHGEKVGETSTSMGFMQLGFGYQQAINRRVALRMDLGGSARVGTTTSSVLADGISAVYSYGVGATVNLVRRSAWQLAATADARGNTLYTVSPLGFVEGVLSSVAGGDTVGALEAGQDSLLQKGDNMRGLIGLRAAYTPAPWIGFTAFIEGGLGDRFQTSDQIGVTNLGVAASFDLAPLIHWPVGFAGSFRNESLSEKGNDVGSNQGAAFGVFYTGRRFFSIGLDNSWNWLKQPETDKTLDLATCRLVLRYDFK